MRRVRRRASDGESLVLWTFTMERRDYDGTWLASTYTMAAIDNRSEKQYVCFFTDNVHAVRACMYERVDYGSLNVPYGVFRRAVERLEADGSFTRMRGKGSFRRDGEFVEYVTECLQRYRLGWDTLVALATPDE